VALSEGTGSRSVNKDSVRDLADTYEVVVATSDFATVYVGKGKATDAYITIPNVPIADDYVALFLAGYGDLLLAADYNDNVDIVAGKANLISFTAVSSVAPLWDKSLTNADAALSDFAFGATIAHSATSTDGPIDINSGIITVPKTATNVGNIAADDSLTLTYKTGVESLGALFSAKSGVGVPIVANSAEARLYTPGISSDKYRTIPGEATGITGSGTILPAATLTFTFTFTADTLIDYDIDAALEFSFKYRAFGSSDSALTIWTIRNGIDYNPDDANHITGGIFPIKFGAGTQPVPGETPDLKASTR
jgi:hypothetical protein